MMLTMNEKTEILNRTPTISKVWGKRFPIPLLSPILKEDITICSVGHAFGQVEPTEPQPATYFVHDFLLDQSQSTGGGSALIDPIQFDLTNSAGYEYMLQAACEKRFQIDLPTDVSTIYFSAFLGRQVTTGLTGGVFAQTSAIIQFGDMTGTSPQITYNGFFISKDNSEAILFEIEGELSSSLGFASITIQAQYAPRTFDPGGKWYDPLSYAVPYGTKSIYPDSETFVLFGYNTSHGVDPGRFVSMV
jgi:hypothetical protein